MRRMLAQARKELTQLVRDWLALALALVLPLILLLLMGIVDFPDRPRSADRRAGP